MSTTITQEMVDALEQAVVSGVLEIEYSDKKLKYRSMAELMKALRYAKSKLNNSAGKNYRMYPLFRKGF